jgi:hypothetical protein
MERVKIRVYAMAFKPLPPNSNPFPFDVIGTKWDGGHYEVSHGDLLSVGVNLSECAQDDYVWNFPPADHQDSRYKIEEANQ